MQIQIYQSGNKKRSAVSGGGGEESVGGSISLDQFNFLLLHRTFFMPPPLSRILVRVAQPVSKHSSLESPSTRKLKRK